MTMEFEVDLIFFSIPNIDSKENTKIACLVIISI